jgi:hypothetical protein
MNPKTQKTQERIRQLQGKEALLSEWEQQPEDVLIANHDYIVGLKVRIRSVRNYILHRRDKEAQIFNGNAVKRTSDR